MAAPQSAFLFQLYNASDVYIGIEETCLPWVMKSLTLCCFARTLAITARQSAKSAVTQACLLKVAALFDMLRKNKGEETCKCKIKTSVHENERCCSWDVDLNDEMRNDASFMENLFRSGNFQFPVLASCVLEIQQIVSTKVELPVVESMFEIMLQSYSQDKLDGGNRLAVFMETYMIAASDSADRVSTQLSKVIARLDQSNYLGTSTSNDVSRVFFYVCLKKLDTIAESYIVNPESLFFPNLLEFASIVID